MSRNVEMAKAAWGEQLPEWVQTLAEACDRTSQADVAKQLRYSGTVVNQALRKKYTGSYGAVEQAVLGAFKAATVRCPVIGEIAAQDCLEHQRAPFAGTNNIRVRLYRACRNACPHSRLPTRSAPKE